MLRPQQTSSEHSSTAPRANREAAESLTVQPLLELQQSVGNQAVLRLLGARTSPSVQRKCASCAPCSHCEDEEELMRKPRENSSTSGLIIQRAANDRGTSGTSATPLRGLIVEDNARQISAGQMRKSEFLSSLRTDVCATADQALTRAGRTTKGCPYLERWLSYYATRDSSYIERSLRRYAPEAAGARTAREYIPAVSRRVARAVDVWATTGQLTGVPEGVSLDQPGSESAPAAERSSTATAETEPVARKARDGQVEETGGPTEIKEQLGTGHSLDAGVRGRMEAAFGTSFSNVRVHTTSTAGKLSDNLKARAFTVGQNIAFSTGEYRPGTLVGDALIAHELAHTLQQKNGNGSPKTKQKETREDSSLEADADTAAVGAVASIWGMAKALVGNTVRNVMPALRSGLKLQKCSSEHCPTGYSWQVVNTSALASGCACTWQCLRGASSGPSISGRDQPRILNMPSPVTRAGVTSGIPGQTLYCGCMPLRDSDGNIIGHPPAGRGVNQDYTGAAAGAAGMRGGGYRPPQTTDVRPPAAEVRSAGGGGGGSRAGGGGAGPVAPGPVRPPGPSVQSQSGSGGGGGPTTPGTTTTTPAPGSTTTPGPTGRPAPGAAPPTPAPAGAGPGPGPAPGAARIHEPSAGHIFRNAPGHLVNDTPANRQLLVDTASNPSNLLGTDRFGNNWYAQTRPDGSQVWVSARNGEIRNGGVNPTPRPFNPSTGLSNP